MNLIAFTVIAIIVACLLDAHTTNALIARGGYEKLSAWLVGRHPSPDTVWIVVGVVPALLGAGIVVWVPELVWLGLAFAAFRAYLALRNHHL